MRDSLVFTRPKRIGNQLTIEAFSVSKYALDRWLAEQRSTYPDFRFIEPLLIGEEWTVRGHRAIRLSVENESATTFREYCPR